MLYRLASESEDSFVTNLFHRYSMIRVLALTDACRTLRHHMSTGDPQAAVNAIRSMIEKETINCTNNSGVKRKIFLDTFKLGDVRKLQQV